MTSKKLLYIGVTAVLVLSALAIFTVTASAEDYTFITKWGSYGTGDGQFDYPRGVAVDSSGNVFVADYDNSRIQKFDSSGTYITKWGSYGNGDGQFNRPRGVAVDSSGNVFVADTWNYRIQKFDSSGTYITKWGSHGNGDGQFNRPYGVAVDSSGDVFVADTYNHRIQKFDSSGGFITKWGSKGTGDGQFDEPNDVAVDSNGDVFVADFKNSRIQKFDSSGGFITKWGSYGTGDGQFQYPRGIAVDSSGNVFVTDTYNHRIQKFDSSGTYITKWGSYGSGDGQFQYPHGIAVDSSGDVFVVDTYNNRIQKFAPGIPEEPSLSFSPSSHDFGDKCEGETDSTTFELWNSGSGTLTYSLSESCDWVEVNPTSGSSTGEHDTITVDINTTGLSECSYTCDISINSNDGSGTFIAKVNVAPLPNCTCGDICVNETGWWRDGSAFQPSDTPIQSAVDNATEGETICVTDGTYNENVDVDTQLTIRSENGAGSTTVQAASSSDHVFEVTADYVTISGFTVKGAGDSHGIYIQNSHYCEVHDNIVSFNDDRGIVFDDGGDNYAYNNIVHNNSAYGAIEAINSDNNTIYNNTAYYNCWGIATNGGSNNLIHNNTIFGNDVGVHLDWPSTGNRVLNNDISYNRGGIVTVHNSADNIINGNWVFSNEGDGLLILTNNNVICSNTVTSNGAGIFLVSSSNNRITDNIASNNDNGICLLESSDNNTVLNNIANSNTWSGIGIFGSLYNSITENTANLNNESGITLEAISKHNIISRNTANANNHNGILVRANSGYESETHPWGPSDNNIISENTADSNNHSGIFLWEGSSNNTLLDNNVNSNSFGIRLSTSCNYCTISDNTASNNAEGIFINPSNDCTLTNNIALNNDWHGIGLFSSSDCTLTNNTALNNGGRGIGLFNSSDCTLTNNIALNNYVGIILRLSSNCTLDSNTASDNKEGIFITDSSNNNVIGYNSVISNGWGGIRLGDGGDPKRNVTGNRVIGNNASYNGDDGIGLEWSAGNTVIGNIVRSNHAEGISLFHSNLSILGDNTAINNNKSGIGLFDSHGNSISSNTVTSNYRKGIFLVSSSDNSITDNNASNNVNGICLLESSDHNTVLNNIANSNTRSGICLLESSDHNTVLNNIANSNARSGIWIFGSLYNNITENTANLNNRCGIALAAISKHNIISKNTANSNNHIGIVVKANSHYESETHPWGPSDNNIISGNTADTNNHSGIFLCEGSSNNTLSSNTASDNNRHGIYLDSSDNNTIRNNTAKSNNWGISLFSSQHNTIMGNTANENEGDGVYLAGSSDNTITNNIVNSNNGIGIASCGCGKNNSITNNIVKLNKWDGIQLASSSNNTAINNNIYRNNGYGVALYESSNNMISSNIMDSNNECGIYLYSSSNNLIYNNYFDNANNAWDDGNNIWNITKTLGTNIIGGPYFGGNYWSDYTGTDSDGDGLGDTLLPYCSNGGITNGGDYHPLVPVGFAPPTITSFSPPSPVIDTICTWRAFNVTVNQTVNVSWYLNGALQQTNGSVQAAKCTLHASVSGEHNVTAVASNPNGTDMQTWIWNVTEAPQGNDWGIKLYVTSGIEADVAEFGLNVNATDGFDPEFDEVEPPPPPGDHQQAYFYYPGNPSWCRRLNTSYIPPHFMYAAEWNSWPFQLAYCGDPSDVTITWNADDIDAVPPDYWLYFVVDGEWIDMRTMPSYTFSATTGTYDFEILAINATPYTFELYTGWNMISFPGDPLDKDPDNIFGPGYYQLVTWDPVSGSYVAVDEVETGIGYWLLVTEDRSVTVLGVPTSEYYTGLIQGWNMIGSIFVDTNVPGGTETIPPNQMHPSLYTWNVDHYDTTQDIDPGLGYWALAYDDCELHVFPAPPAAPLPLPQVLWGDNDWHARLAITSGAGTDVAEFGLHEDATDDFSAKLDVPEPPSPPPSATSPYQQVYFYDPENPLVKKLSTSYIPHHFVNDDEEYNSWLFRVEYSGDASDVTIKWNAKDINTVPAEYSLLFIADGEQIDMRTTPSYTFRAKTGTYEFEIRALTGGKKPDLVIEDSYDKGKAGRYTVFFVVKNIGTATAPGGHYATLYVDGVEIEKKLVSTDLEPGETYKSSFKTKVGLTGKVENIKVCADSYNDVDELDEANNCLKGRWQPVAEKPTTDKPPT